MALSDLNCTRCNKPYFLHTASLLRVVRFRKDAQGRSEKYLACVGFLPTSKGKKILSLPWMR